MTSEFKGIRDGRDEEEQQGLLQYDLTPAFILISPGTDGKRIRLKISIAQAQVPDPHTPVLFVTIEISSQVQAMVR